jgi:hypothetical protein
MKTLILLVSRSYEHTIDSRVIRNEHTMQRQHASQFIMVAMTSVVHWDVATVVAKEVNDISNRRHAKCNFC